MLERLSVENLVLVDAAVLDLHPGLNVVTGETGAGKTMLTQALGLALGAPADADAVGPGGPEAYVEATFAVAADELALDAFDGIRELVPEDEDVVVLARRVTAGGRSRALVAGRSTTRAALEAAGERLVSVVSQHEARRLARPAAQRALLDAFLGDDQAARLDALAAAWRVRQDAARALAAVEEEIAGADRVLADLADLVARVEAVDPQPGEDDALRGERDRLRHADALVAAATAAAALLNPDEGEGALSLAGRAELELRSAERYDAALGAHAEELRDAVVRLEEAARALHAYAADIDSDTARLDAVEERIARLDDLARRHGGLAEALAAAGEARERLERLERSEETLAAARAVADAADAAARTAAGAVGDARRAGAPALAAAVEGHLADLGMADARLRVELAEVELGASGAESVRLLVAANPGLPFAPAGEAASGGELSRLALSLRLAAQNSRRSPTLVFDEVDAGVGGRTARAVGEKLRDLAIDAQLLVITHLPQIAALADRHFRVVKEPGEPTIARIEQLGGPAVEEELARMLGGEEGSGEALSLARALRAGA